VEYVNLKIRKRKFFGWLLVLIWGLIILFALEIATGSLEEREFKAAYIMFVLALFIFLLGILIWYVRKKKLKKISREAEEIKRLKSTIE